MSLYAIYVGLKSDDTLRLHSTEFFEDPLFAENAARNYAFHEAEVRNAVERFIPTTPDDFEYYVNSIENMMDYRVEIIADRSNKNHIIYSDDGDYFPDLNR